MIPSLLRNEKGMALIAIYITSLFITTISAAAFSKSFFEMRQVEREISRLRSFAAAEAGVQNAMAQIAVNAYTGFINTSPINISNFQAVDGSTVGSYSVAIDYPDQADWVTVNSAANVDGDARTLEGRIFLDSNLSKYLVYADAPDFGSGTNAQYGEPDTTDADRDGIPDYPEFVPPSEYDRAALYFTGDWTTSGNNVRLYGDTNAQGRVNGNASSRIRGDAYTGQYTTNGSGAVTRSGVVGGIPVGDGFSDDRDRNGDGIIDASDYPDHHGLTQAGGGDNHRTETLTQIDNSFYRSHNSIPAYGGLAAQNRYLKFVSAGSGAATQVVEYDPTFTNVLNTYNLPATAILYVNGSIYAKGEIGGRVSVVSSSNIYFDGNTTYSTAQTRADTAHSVAFMAKNKLYFRANDLAVSGILYAENNSNSPVSYDSNYNVAGQYDPAGKVRLRLSGNRIIKGSTNLSNYQDRVYGYDPSLKYFRPPGIPVVPSLRTVREK